jgi:glycosyltransferase involved in cell wall biosynthesis
MSVRFCPPDTVLFPGLLTGDAKWGALHAADVFVLSSHQENFGVAVAEALACALPVLISNKVNIWREIDQFQAGLIETDDEEGTERLLRRWLSLPIPAQEKMRLEARHCFETLFEIENAAQSLLDEIDPSLPCLERVRS